MQLVAVFVLFVVLLMLRTFRVFVGLDGSFVGVVFYVGWIYLVVCCVYCLLGYLLVWITVSCLSVFACGSVCRWVGLR